MTGRPVVWVGIGSFLLMASGFVWVMCRALRAEDEVASQGWERGPEPMPAGRHRAPGRSLHGRDRRVL